MTESLCFLEFFHSYSSMMILPQWSCKSSMIIPQRWFIYDVFVDNDFSTVVFFDNEFFHNDPSTVILLWWFFHDDSRWCFLYDVCSMMFPLRWLCFFSWWFFFDNVFFHDDFPQWFFHDVSSTTISLWCLL